LIGRTISQYRVLEQLGAGGMGEVYLAQDLRLGRKVALKFLAPEQAGRATFVERFRREAQAAAALQHPNIVTIYSVAEEDGLPYLAMELVEGSTLDDLIPPGGMPLDLMLRIAVQLADALCAAHGRGVIHRDIKPRNLMIDAKERLKVLDFGIAKRLPVEDEPTVIDGGPAPEALTREGQILGTISYMSPEQLQGLPLDARSDLFSAGVVLYQMATGRLPFHSSNPAEQMMNILEQHVPLPGVVRAGLPRRFDEIVARCLESDPRQRYQSARVLHDDLLALWREPVSSPRIASVATLPPAPPPPGTWKRFRKPIAGSVLAALTLLAGAAALIRHWPSVRPAPEHGIHALAVLPLENLSGEQEYFVDGMTDALISSLSNVGQVRVISRQSVMRFKKSEEALPAIARQLGVDLVLTGSILRAGPEVRITIGLVQAEPEQQIWAATYKRDLRNVLAMQDQVVLEIARQIQLELTQTEQSRLNRKPQVDPDAYELYLQGHYFWEKRTQESLLKSVGYFERAIAKDPGYAAAHAGLAGAWALLGYFRYAPPDSAFNRARTESVRALELDEDLADAHAILGYVMFFHDWDGAGAERELRRSLALSPSNASVQLWLYTYLSSVGRLSEAEQHLRNAEQLNPLSLTIVTALAGHQLMVGQLDKAVSQCRRAIGMEPGYALAYEFLWSALDAQGKPGEAFQAYRRALSLWGYTRAADEAERVFRQSGYRAGLRAAGQVLAREPDPEKQPVSLIASTFAAGGDPDQTLRWLEQGFERREPFVLWLQQHRDWDSLRTLPRFQELVRRVEAQRRG
jgi:serine/threonine protein kinase/tetratricopeptide (TPR) repeat protein